MFLLSENAQQSLLFKYPWVLGPEIAKELIEKKVIVMNPGRGWFFTPEGRELANTAMRELTYDGRFDEGEEWTAQEVQVALGIKDT